MRNHSYENDFDLHENETACRTHIHMKGFALRLVLKQRHKRTRKWPVLCQRKTEHNTRLHVRFGGTWPLILYSTSFPGLLIFSLGTSLFSYSVTNPRETWKTMKRCKISDKYSSMTPWGINGTLTI